MAASALLDMHEGSRRLPERGKEFNTEDTENAECAEKIESPEKKRLTRRQKTERRRGRLSAW